MKKILIYDVAVEKTGVATVYKQYYNDRFNLANLVVLYSCIIISTLTFVFFGSYPPAYCG